MTWTQERIETLRTLWAEGLSSSQIAKQLGGVTRSAVCGKINRLRRRGSLAFSARARFVRRSLKFAGPRIARSCATPRPPKQRSLVLSWKAKPAPKPPVKVDPNSPASLAAATLLGRAQSAERRCDAMRAKGVNLSW